MAEAEPSLNIPSLLTLAVVSFFVLRWFLSSRTSTENGGLREQLQPRGRRVDPAQVEQISQMFPQLNRREIMWDLHRNGGSVTATTERILTGRGLETPPPSYQPEALRTTPPEVPTTSRPASKAQSENLIARYKLESKVGIESTDGASGDDGGVYKPDATWSQNRTERQRLLQKRRDDMILAARRKMLEKEKAPKSS